MLASETWLHAMTDLILLPCVNSRLTTGHSCKSQWCSMSNTQPKNDLLGPAWAWETQETSRNPSTDERHQPMNTYAFYNPSRNTYAAYEGFVISLLSVAQNHWPQRKYAEILNILNRFGRFCYPYFEPCRSSTGSAIASAMMIFEGFQHARRCHRSVNPRLGQSRRSGASDGLGTTAPIVSSFDSLEVFSWFEVQTYRSRWQNDTYLILQVGILNYNYI